MGKKRWKNNVLEVLSRKVEWFPFERVKMVDKKLMVGMEYRYWNKNKKEYGPFDLFNLRYTEWNKNMDNNKWKGESIDKTK